VISNGVLNLVPEKEQAVAEIARVLKPGGRAQIADIIIGAVLPDAALRDIDHWTG
jgi:ubiquinone/menaquinone biosynthesis C-methylase UbiE